MYLSLSCIQLHLIHLIDIMNAVFPYDINYHHIVMYSLSVPHFPFPHVLNLKVWILLFQRAFIVLP